MNPNQEDGKEATYRKFWNFLAYLKSYLESAKASTTEDDDPARTRLLSAFAQHMLPVLDVDMVIVGYRSMFDGKSSELQLVPESVTPAITAEPARRLLERCEKLNWKFPFERSGLNELGSLAMLYDESLERVPFVFEGVTALAMCKVTLLEREYYLFFCDLCPRTENCPVRFNDFDKTMLRVAVGLIELGFQQGARGGIRAGRSESESHAAQAVAAVRVLSFLLVVFGVIGAALLLMRAVPVYGPWLAVLVLFVAVVAALGLAGVLAPVQIERLLGQLYRGPKTDDLQ